MIYLVSRRSKIPIAENIGFGYSLATILTFYLMKLNGVEALINLNVFGIIFSSILSYLEPVEELLYLYVKRSLHSSALRDAFNSTFLDYTRLKIKAGFYLIFLFGLLMIARGLIDLIFCLLALASILIVVGMWFHDIRQLPMRVSAVLAYYGTVRTPTRETSDFVIDALAKVRNALEAGNWKEAWRWLNAVGIPDIKIPKKIIEEARKLE